MKHYSTLEVARIFGVHTNTVRLYEALDLIQMVNRKPNGYRDFTDFHVAQMALARTALEVEVLQNGLRKQSIRIIKASACKEFDQAILLTEQFLDQIRTERSNAEEAIAITEQYYSRNKIPVGSTYLTRKETADFLSITMDTLRNWEMNGLLTVKRKANGYRVYSEEDIRQLKIIRSLRCANYSLSAILRMLIALSRNPDANIRHVINTPSETDDIVSVCDKLLTSLQLAEQNGMKMLSQLKKMKESYQ